MRGPTTQRPPFFIPPEPGPLPVRRSPRLPGVDYAGMGAYFVTTNTHRWRRLFGTIADRTMRLSPEGAKVHESWLRIPETYPHVALDAFVVMPHHVHGILLFDDPLRHDPGEAPYRRRHALPEVVRGFKSFAAVAINRMRERPGERVWHRSFHDRILRDGAALEAARAYIAANPARWKG